MNKFSVVIPILLNIKSQQICLNNNLYTYILETGYLNAAPNKHLDKDDEESDKRPFSTSNISKKFKFRTFKRIKEEQSKTGKNSNQDSKHSYTKAGKNCSINKYLKHMYGSKVRQYRTNEITLKNPNSSVKIGLQLTIAKGYEDTNKKITVGVDKSLKKDDILLNTTIANGEGSRKQANEYLKAAINILTNIQHNIVLDTKKERLPINVENGMQNNLEANVIPPEPHNTFAHFPIKIKQNIEIERNKNSHKEKVKRKEEFDKHAEASDIADQNVIISDLSGNDDNEAISYINSASSEYESLDTNELKKQRLGTTSEEKTSKDEETYTYMEKTAENPLLKKKSPKGIEGSIL